VGAYLREVAGSVGSIERPVENVRGGMSKESYTDGRPEAVISAAELPTSRKC